MAKKRYKVTGIPEYKNAGKAGKREPIYTSDPKKVRAYQDSLAMAINSRLAEQQFLNQFRYKDITDTPGSYELPTLTEMYKGIKDSYDPVVALIKNGIPRSNSNDRQVVNLFSSDTPQSAADIQSLRNKDGTINRVISSGKYVPNSVANKKTPIVDKLFGDDRQDFLQVDYKTKLGSTGNINQIQVTPSRRYLHNNETFNNIQDPYEGYTNETGNKYRLTDVYAPPYIVFEHPGMQPEKIDIYNYDAGAEGRSPSERHKNANLGKKQDPSSWTYDANEMYNVNFPIYKYPIQPYIYQELPTNPYSPNVERGKHGELTRIPQSIQRLPISQPNQLPTGTGYTPRAIDNPYITESTDWYSPEVQGGQYTPAGFRTTQKMQMPQYQKGGKVDKRMLPKQQQEVRTTNYIPPLEQFRTTAINSEAGYPWQNKPMYMNPIANRESDRMQEHQKRSTTQKVGQIVRHPMTAASYVVQGQPVPDYLEYADKNKFDNAIDIINPLTYYDAGKRVLTGEHYRNPENNFLDATLLTGLDAGMVYGVGKGVKNTVLPPRGTAKFAEADFVNQHGAKWYSNKPHIYDIDDMGRPIVYDRTSGRFTTGDNPNYNALGKEEAVSAAQKEAIKKAKFSPEETKRLKEIKDNYNVYKRDLEEWENYKKTLPEYQHERMQLKPDKQHLSDEAQGVVWTEDGPIFRNNYIRPADADYITIPAKGGIPNGTTYTTKSGKTYKYYNDNFPSGHPVTPEGLSSQIQMAEQSARPSMQQIGLDFVPAQNPTTNPLLYTTPIIANQLRGRSNTAVQDTIQAVTPVQQWQSNDQGIPMPQDTPQFNRRVKTPTKTQKKVEEVTKDMTPSARIEWYTQHGYQDPKMDSTKTLQKKKQGGKIDYTTGANRPADKVHYTPQQMQNGGKAKKAVIVDNSDVPTDGMAVDPNPRMYLSGPKMRISDPRKIRATTQQPINPNVDLLAGKYSQRAIGDIALAARKQGVDPYTLEAIAMHESGFGKINDDLGRAGRTANTSYAEGAANIYAQKVQDAKRLGIANEVDQIQLYNGTGRIPYMEGVKKIYGVPLPKEGIDMQQNPLYGKQIMDIRDNVLRKNPQFIHYVDSVYNSIPPKKWDGGPIRYTNTANKPATVTTTQSPGYVPQYSVGEQYMMKHPQQYMRSAEGYGTPQQQRDHEYLRNKMYQQEADERANREFAHKLLPASELANKFIDAGNVIGAGHIGKTLGKELVNAYGRQQFKKKVAQGTVGNILKEDYKIPKDWKKYYMKDYESRPIPPTGHQDAYRVHKELMERMNSPEGQRRLWELNRSGEDVPNIQLISDMNEAAYYSPPHESIFTGKMRGPQIGLHPDLPPSSIPYVTRHELEHSVQGGKPTEIDALMKTVELKYEPGSIKSKMERNRIGDKYNLRTGDIRSLSNEPEAIDYYIKGSQGKEAAPFLSELQQHLVDKKYVQHAYDKITPEIVEKAYKDYMSSDKGYPLRIFNISRPTQTNFDIMSQGLNKMLGVGVPVGVGAAVLQDKQYGGTITGANNNTMKRYKVTGVPQMANGGRFRFDQNANPSTQAYQQWQMTNKPISVGRVTQAFGQPTGGYQDNNYGFRTKLVGFMTEPKPIATQQYRRKMVADPVTGIGRIQQVPVEQEEWNQYMTGVPTNNAPAYNYPQAPISYTPPVANNSPMRQPRGNSNMYLEGTNDYGLDNIRKDMDYTGCYGGGCYEYGGNIPGTYNEGNVYDVDEQEVARLQKMGYKIRVL